MRWDIETFYRDFKCAPPCNLPALPNTRVLRPGTLNAHDRLLFDTHSYARSLSTCQAFR